MVKNKDDDTWPRPLTVGELIAKLQAFDPNGVVSIASMAGKTIQLDLAASVYDNGGAEISTDSAEAHDEDAAVVARRMTTYVVGTVSAAYEDLLTAIEDERPSMMTEEEWGASTVGALLGTVEAIAARFTKPEERELLEAHRKAGHDATVETGAATDRAMRKNQN